MKNSTKQNIFERLVSNLKAAGYIYIREFKGVFRDRGVLIVIILAPLLYPLLYPYLYKNETVADVPVAVVDMSNTGRSKEFTRKLDATSHLKVTTKLTNLEQAKTELYQGKIHGIIYFPKEFNKKIVDREQATVGMYSDMSSFLYYRAMMQAVNYVALDMGEDIQTERLNALGQAGEQAVISTKPIPSESVILFNPGMGFASFLVPALLILIIHQTLVFGIGIAAGSEREDNPNGELVLHSTSRGGLFRVVFGRAVSYFVLYLVLTLFVLVVVPRIFNLPHIGDVRSLIQLIVPFLLATIFFGMTLSVFNLQRETQLILFIFFSIILLFLSGISWPESNMNGFWKAFGALFPATFGIRGYIKVNTMAATVGELRVETIGLWIQALVYFVTTSLLYFREVKMHRNEPMDEPMPDPILE